MARPRAGRIAFEWYADDVWLPSRHIDAHTRAGYLSYLRRHFVSFFGAMALADVMPSTVKTVQQWVSLALKQGLSPRSVVNYHVMLHSVFARAVRDRLIAFNPCADTELPRSSPRSSAR